MKQVLATEQAPAAIGPYSQGIAAGETVYVSGQLPLDPATGAFPEGIAAQTAQSLKNIQAILAQQGMTLANVPRSIPQLQYTWPLLIDSLMYMPKGICCSR